MPLSRLRSIFSPELSSSSCRPYDLNTPFFWIEIKVNKETISVLFTRWMEGGVHLSVMSQASSSFFFFFVFLVYLIFLLCLHVSNFKSWLSEKSILFIYCLFLTEFLLVAAAAR